MYFRLKKATLYLFVAVMLLMSGCDGAVEDAEVTNAVATQPPDTATPLPTDTPAPPTDTPTPEPTDTPSPTPTDTPTNTPTPSPTAVPTDTPTPVATDTPTAIPPTPTPPPTASPTPVPVAAHTFPETPIMPFDRDTFVQYLGMVRDSYRSFDNETIVFGKPGVGTFNCGSFGGWLRLWVVEAPGFTDVPPQWQPLYEEYRHMLRQIVEITTEIRAACDGAGNTVSEETVQKILEFLLWAYPRSEEMVAEASQIL